MTSNPTPDPESARALLWRHGLPEDVIDGALCLHAQELAAVQRREAAVWGVDTAAGKRILGAADLIDPASAAAPAVSSVVGQATRDRIATAMHSELTDLPAEIRRQAGLIIPPFTNAVLRVLRGLTLRELEQVCQLSTTPSRPDPKTPRGDGLKRAHVVPAEQAAEELAALAVNASRALGDEKRHYEIACHENARLRAAIERVRRLHDALDAETDLTSPNDEITRGAAARKIAAALDGWTDPADEARQQCPGYETVPNRCTCGCYGCKHHCAAHDPSRLADEAQQPAVGAQASADLIEDYLRFLRGQGPEPDLSDLPSEQREAVAGQFEIVKALADRDPELPPLDRDPVALRLGLLDAAPAAECSAQHRNFDDGRLCIRAAQHRGDHIDERGFHWSDTVAVYPVGGGTFRSGVRLSAVGARQPDTETPDLPYTYTDDDGDKFTVATTTASTLDGEAPVVTLDIDGTGGGVVYVRPERVEEVVTALRVAGHTASSAVPGRSAATSTHEETQA